jgi:hypothetical protein
MTAFEVDTAIAVCRAAARPQDTAGLGIADAVVLKTLLQRPVTRALAERHADILPAVAITTYYGQWPADSGLTLRGFRGFHCP